MTNQSALRLHFQTGKKPSHPCLQKYINIFLQPACSIFRALCQRKKNFTLKVGDRLSLGQHDIKVQRSFSEKNKFSFLSFSSFQAIEFKILNNFNGSGLDHISVQLKYKKTLKNMWHRKQTEEQKIFYLFSFL